MFTGIVEGLGKINDIIPNSRQNTTKLIIDLGKHIQDLKIGQSVSINGVCLTSIEIFKNQCTFEMIQETRKLTNLDKLQKNDLVNIERSIIVGERIEGHFVLGHIDGIAPITKIETSSEEVKIWFQIPDDLLKFVVKKGSIALDGISLTVVDLENSLASVCIIPHTLEVTNFGKKKSGDLLNIETDVLAKYALK